MSIIHSQLTINIELAESETGEVILCLNFLFSPTSQLLAGVKIILIIFRYFADSKGLKPFPGKRCCCSSYFPLWPCWVVYSGQARVLSEHHCYALRS